MQEALNIKVSGVVQGVGFRPFVFRVAGECGVSGWVLNARDGVHIHTEGNSDALDKFVLKLVNEAPAPANVQEIDLKECEPEGFSTFEIRFSDDGDHSETTLVSPDIATCDECVRELLGRGGGLEGKGDFETKADLKDNKKPRKETRDRRFHYPFINCTNCGPRFTIIRDLPYDRKNTSMSMFAMCEKCAQEYKDPANRRFHAQPNACFECGPHINFFRFDDADGIRWGDTLEKSDAIIQEAVEMLALGKIVAVKGLGGFHLVCDAQNPLAVSHLRQAKRRGRKPFAVMMRNVSDVENVCCVSKEEKEQLMSPARPIVLLKKRCGNAERALNGVADGLSELGVMLPSTPLQYLILEEFAKQARSRDGACKNAEDIDKSNCDARKNAEVIDKSNDDAHKNSEAIKKTPILVMTSGNVSGCPIVTTDAEAQKKFKGVADAVLGNKREILSRFDDSVLRVLDAGGSQTCVQMVRRARGFAPLPLDVAQSGDVAVFATGPEQKNTCTLLTRGRAYVSQHIGDLENIETYNAWLEAKDRLEHLFGSNLENENVVLACDAHPSYMSTQWAVSQQNKCEQQQTTNPIKVNKVQHHHAHVASVMAENGLEEAVCGIAFDGTGYGTDGKVWGGEVLISNLTDFERFANFAYVPMPGAQACVSDPLRMAYGVLYAFDLLEHPVAQEIFSSAEKESSPQTTETHNFSPDTLNQMIEQGVNTPYTSSVGRLFDAASALLGICEKSTYQGEAAIMLEAAMFPQPTTSAPNPYEISIVKNVATKNSTAQDTSVLLLDAAPTFKALLDDVGAGVSASTISRKFHDAFVNAILQVAQTVYAVYGISTVALCGGVFMNRYITEHALDALQNAGFTVALNKDLPPGDGSISFGQAVVTCQQYKQVPRE